jgi:hypothetical protein
LTTSTGEISRVPAELTTDYLSDNGLVVVPTAEPFDRVFPGMQTRVHISQEGVRLDQTGLVVGTNDLFNSAATLVQQFAYNRGFPPGHAGAHHSQDGSHTEPLASPDTKELLRRVDNEEYVGFLCLAEVSEFVRAPAGDYGAGSVITRRRLPGRALYGATVADVGRFLGPGGFDGLRDCIDHPVAGPRLAHYGLRSVLLDPPEPGH